MKPLSLNKIYKIFEGTEHGADAEHGAGAAAGTEASSCGRRESREDVTITSVTTDSCLAGPGSLFVALRGERFDGHAFVPQVLSQGAEAALVRQEKAAALRESLPASLRSGLIAVPDPLTALGQVAKLQRESLSIPVVGITGSVGKTSTKDLTACAFSSLGSVARTKLNFNNEIGLPLTLLSVEEQDNALIGEMGMRGLGEIAYLTEILQPQIGIITNIGVSHIERLGSRRNIMLAKTEICAGMPEGSVLLVFGGDRASGAEADFTEQELRERVDSFGKKIRVRYFGLTPDCDYWADGIEVGNDGNVSFTFHPWNRRVRLQVPGVHQVSNAAAALAAADLCGISAEAAISGIEAFRGDRVRQNILRRRERTVIDDTYNAGPESMQAALAVLGSLPGIRRRIAVLGSMLELGNASGQAHASVCRAAERNGVDILITVGDTWQDCLPGCQVPQKAACACWKEAVAALRDLCGEERGVFGKEGDGFLIKGSHAMHMEEIVKVMTEGETTEWTI